MPFCLGIDASPVVKDGMSCESRAHQAERTSFCQGKRLMPMLAMRFAASNPSVSAISPFSILIRGSCRPLRPSSRENGEDSCRLPIVLALLVVVDDSELLVQLPDFSRCRLERPNLRELFQVAHVVLVRRLLPEVVELVDGELGYLVPSAKEHQRGNVRLREPAPAGQLVPLLRLEGIVLDAGQLR